MAFLAGSKGQNRTHSIFLLNDELKLINPVCPTVNWVEKRLIYTFLCLGFELVSPVSITYDNNHCAKQTVVCKFDSHWVLHTLDLTPNFRNTHNVIVIIIENEHGDVSSVPRLSCVHFTKHLYSCQTYESTYSLSSFG